VVETKEGAEQVSGWSKLLYALGVLGIVAQVPLLLIYVLDLVPHDEYTDTVWSFWGDLEFLAFLLCTAMLLMMLGMLLSIHQVDLSRWVVLTGVVIVEACLVWAIIRVPDNGDRLQLLVATLLPAGSFLFFHAGYNRAWSRIQLPKVEEEPDVSWWGRNKGPVLMGTFFLLFAGDLYFSLWTWINGDGVDNGRDFLRLMMLLIFWQLMVLLPPISMLLSFNDGNADS